MTDPWGEHSTEARRPSPALWIYAATGGALIAAVCVVLLTTGLVRFDRSPEADATTETATQPDSPTPAPQFVTEPTTESEETPTSQPSPTAAPRPTPTPTPTLASKPATLRPGGIYEFDFGTNEALVLAWFRLRFGPELYVEDPSPGHAFCPETVGANLTAYHWSTTSESFNAGDVVLRFRDGEFVGWRIADDVLGIKDANGIQLGSTRSEVARAYLPITPYEPHISSAADFGDEVVRYQGPDGDMGVLLLNGKVTNMWSGIDCFP